MKGRSGAHFLPAFQEVVAECNRLGYPVKVAHTDRAREAVSRAATEWMQAHLIQPSFTQGDDPKANGLAERLVGWLHLAAAGLGYEHWPTAMALACAEHRHRVLQLPGKVHQYGQRVVFKSKHPTGESKKPFLRWEYATYLTPCPRTDMGHLLLRESTGAYLAVELASERMALQLLESEDFSLESCSQILEESFRSAANHSRRTHRGPADFSVVMGAYSHGGVRGITRLSRMHPNLCRYLNAYLRHKAREVPADLQWSSLMVLQADEVAVHKDSRNEPGTLNFVATVSARRLWVSAAQDKEVSGASRLESRVDLCNKKGVRVAMDGYHLGGQAVAFDPKQHHALSRPTDWVIAGYSPLGTRKLEPEHVAELDALGFKLAPAQEDLPRVCKLVGPNPQRMPMPVLSGRRRRRVSTQHLNVRFARIPPEEWRAMCELDEDQFEQSISRWTRVLRGTDEEGMGPLSAAIPRGLLLGTLRDGIRWEDQPILEYRLASGEVVPIARVFQFTDDDNMYLDDSPFPDRMMMFDVLDIERDVREVIVIRVLVEPNLGDPNPLMQRILQEPGPSPPEVMAVRIDDPASGVCSLQTQEECPQQLPVPLPNPASLPRRSFEDSVGQQQSTTQACKAEVPTTQNLEEILEALAEPLSVTHTAAQEEVRRNLPKWKPAVEKELATLKEPGVLISHYGEEAKSLMEDPRTSVIPLKGVFTAKPPSSSNGSYYRRKCRLVACGNQTPFTDVESLYASGAPAELVRAALVEASSHMWGAYTCDIRSAFTLTPIPSEAGRRYVLRPPRWLVELGLAQEGECYTLGRVLYGFREAPVWWASFRDEVLKKGEFDGCRLVQGEADPSIWKIMKGTTLKGFVITYVDDFLVLSDAQRATAFHRWILEEAKWETDGLAEASEISPVRFLGMQLKRYEDGSFALDQEAYIDELIRSHNLTSAMRSKISCPREVMYGSDADGPDDGTEPSHGEAALNQDEATVRQAQRIAGECLWLSQRTRIDISFTTSVMCSAVASDPAKALAIGGRLLMYLAQTKDYRLRLKGDPKAPVLRVFTDASFAPEGKNSYGGHVLEFRGAPVVWRAGRQQLIAMSSAEAELIQVVEGCTYGESFMSLLSDLQVSCTGAQVEVDNTAAIALVKGGCSQRTRHLKVRGAKLNQLLQQGWDLNHCQGLYQKADILTKPLPSARLRYLCDLLGLEPGEHQESPKVHKVHSAGKVFKICLAGLLTSMQGVVCKGEEVKPALEVDWPWELLVAMVLIILST
eukprot:s9351_g1.t1